MTTPDLDVLGALTRDYAAFQSRKSGLATALGGLMAILLALAALSPDLMGARARSRVVSRRPSCSAHRMARAMGRLARSSPYW